MTRGEFWSSLRRAVGYVRVSKARDKMVSPEIQRDAIQAYADRNGYVIVDWFEDLDKSGRTFEKRAVKQIVEAIAAGEFEAVILWKWSRWGRNAVMSGMYVNEAIAAGGKVFAATEDIDTSTAIGKFHRGFMFQLAELESDQKSEQWRETHAVRRKNGLPHTTAPRFGYTYDAGAGYVPDSTESAMLAEAYRRFIGGESMRSITFDVNARGFRSRQRVKDSEGNRVERRNLFTPTSWGRLMDTGFAAGLIRERSPEKLAEIRAKAEKNGKTISDMAKSTLADFDVWRPGAHKPIIDRETWDSYKALRLENASKAPGHIVGKHAFTGLLMCDMCDCKMVSQASVKHNKHNWRCRTVQDNRSCKGVTLSNRKIERAVLDWIESKAQGIDTAQEQAEALAAARVAKDEAEALRAEAAKVNRRIENLKDMREYGELTRDEYRERKAAADADAERLAGLLRAAEKRAVANGADMLPVFQSIRDTWAKAEGPEKRAMLSQVLHAVRIAPGGIVIPIPIWGSVSQSQAA